MLDGEWDRHLYKTELLKAVYPLMLEQMDVFDLRRLAKEFFVPARRIADLIAAVYDRISLDIDTLTKDHPRSHIVEIRTWGPDGCVGYTLAADKVGENKWHCLI